MKTLEVQTDEEVMLSTLEPGDVFVGPHMKLSFMKIINSDHDHQWAVNLDDGSIIAFNDVPVRAYLDAAIVLEPASVGL